MLDILLKNLEQNGVVGVVLAFMLWLNYKLITKLFKVIETNTKALADSNNIEAQSLKAINKTNDFFIEGREHYKESTRTHNELHKLVLIEEEKFPMLDAIDNKLTEIKNFVLRRDTQ